MKRLVCAMVLLFLSSAAAQADVRPEPPNEPERVSAPLVIKRGPIRGVERNVQAKIIIPKYLVQQGVAGAAAPEAMGALPANYGTWIAGIALSLAAVSGVFVVRGKRATKTITASVLAGAIALGSYTAVQADLAPPRPAGSEIVIELVDDGESVTLLLPR